MAAFANAVEPVEPIPETSPAERVAADAQAIGAPVVDAERVRDSVPLWFHTFAVAPGIYTPGIARDHGYRLAVLGANRFAGRSVLDVGAFDGFYSFPRSSAVRDALSRSTMSNTSTGCALGSV